MSERERERERGGGGERGDSLTLIRVVRGVEF